MWHWNISHDVSAGCKRPSGYLHCQGKFNKTPISWDVLDQYYRVKCCFTSFEPPFMQCQRDARCLLQKAKEVFLMFYVLTLPSPHIPDL